MNSITTRVWIAGASGRLGSALSHRFGGNTAYKLVRMYPLSAVSPILTIRMSSLTVPA